jgi:hypothetical protein
MLLLVLLDRSLEGRKNAIASKDTYDLRYRCDYRCDYSDH